MNEVFKENDLTWNQCVGLSVDNTAVNLGVRNGLKAKIFRENENVYVVECPCQIKHKTAMKADKAFVENVILTLKTSPLIIFTGWTKVETERANCLNFVSLYCKILNHISVRWL